MSSFDSELKSLIEEWLKRGDNVLSMYDALHDAAERLAETPSAPRPALSPHRVMTPEEYAAMPIQGWHEVCRDIDGAGGVGIRYLSQ